MQTAEPDRRGRALAWGGLAAVLAGGLALRLWGLGQGLPFAYNADEADHFVPRAVRMFKDGTLNPHYFENPPGFTYLLHWLYAVAYGSGGAVVRTFALHPGDLYTLGRVAAAVLGTLALWLLYLAGERLLGRAVGLLAAAIEACAFLPVFYAHLAVNDVPTLAPLTLSLLGAAGVLRSGRRRWHLLAGLGLGLAIGTKYTAGIALLPYLAAVAARFLRGRDGAGREALLGLALAGAVTVAAFLLSNPYSLLDYSAFHSSLVHQSTRSAEAQGKLGAPRDGGLVYYAWTLTWGFGWVPTIAALGGAVAIWRRERALGWVLVPAPVLFLLFMGVQGRYFGRWLLPVFPLLCLLSAFFALQCVSWASARSSRLASSRPARGLLTAALVAALLAQGLVHSVHAGLVLSRTDTRTITRRWLTAHVPAGTGIVLEPVAPDEWARVSAPGTSTHANPYRWRKYPTLLLRITPGGALAAAPLRKVGIEDYERTLAPALLDWYTANGFCVLVSASTERGRAEADPSAVPGAIAYYRALESRATPVFRASPYRSGASPVPFGFDWSFDYYPLAYERPGPALTVWRLHGGACG